MSNTLRGFLSKGTSVFLIFLLLPGALRCQSAPRADFNQALSEAGKFFEDGDFAAVIQRLSPWVKKYPNDAELNHGLGLAYYQQQDFAATIRHLSSALQHQPVCFEQWITDGIGDCDHDVGALHCLLARRRGHELG